LARRHHLKLEWATIFHRENLIRTMTQSINKPFAALCLCLPLLLTATAARAEPSADPGALRARAVIGDAVAQEQLGRLFERGAGLRQSYTEARQWYFKAAAQGNTEAEYRLGVIYDIGEGVAQSNPEALKWYKLAATQGHVAAQIRLGDLYARQYRDSVFAARERVTPLNHPDPAGDYREQTLLWYHRAANSGNPEAQAALGEFYALDLGYKDEAYFWLFLAAASDPVYKTARDKAATKLDAAALSNCQQRLLTWKPTPKAVAAPPTAATDNAPPPVTQASSPVTTSSLSPVETAAAPPPVHNAPPSVHNAPPPAYNSPPANNPPIPAPATPSASHSPLWPPTKSLSLSAPIISLPPGSR
jgi:TPR repeat protein